MSYKKRHLRCCTLSFSPFPLSISFLPLLFLPLPSFPFFFFFFLNIYLFGCWTSLVAQMAKRLPIMWGTRVLSLSREDLQEKKMATHSSILAWKIPWMEEPGRLQSMGSQRVGHD